MTALHPLRTSGQRGPADHADIQRAGSLSDNAEADAYGVARAVSARSTEPGPQNLPNQAPTVLIDAIGSPLGTETKVDSSPTFSDLRPALATLAGGGHVAVWASSGQDGSSYGIYAQRHDANGVPLGAETRVNTYTTNTQIDPAIAALTGGGYVVVWESVGQDFGAEGVFAQRYDANGVPQGAEARVNTTTMQSQKAATVASLAGGGYVVAWQSTDQDGSSDGIFLQRHDATGNRLGGETLVNNTTLGFQVEPAIASLAGGGFVVVWYSATQDPGNNAGVFMQRYSDSGARLGTETRVNTTLPDHQLNPAIAALAGGGFVVVWQSNAQDGSDYGIYAQRYDAAGVPQGSETRVNTVTAGSQINPAVAALTGGGYVVTWQGPDASGTGVYAQRYDAAGVARGPETRINDFTANGQANPAITALPGDDYLISWTSFNQDGSNTSGVYARRFGDIQTLEQVALDLKTRILVNDADAGSGTITVTLAVAQGVLTVSAGGSGAAVSGSGTATVNINGTLTQIRALLQTDATSSVSFTPNLNNPPTTIALTVTVNDNGSSGDGGPLSASASTAIEIIPINDAPQAYFATRNLVLGNNHVFSASDFRFYDEENHGLLSVTIATLPNQGTILLNGAPIAAGSVISASAIAAGLLTYVPDPGEQGVPYTSFTFRVRDNGGTANGGQDTSTNIANVQFNVSTNPVYLYGFDMLDGIYPTIQAGLDAAYGYQYMQVAGGTYAGTVTFDVAGLIVTFDPTGVQNLTWTPVGTLGIEITAGEGNDVIATGAGIDVIRGEGGNDILNGGGGNDRLIGGVGDDIYVVDTLGDEIFESAGQGNDRVAAAASYRLAAGKSVETLAAQDNSLTTPLNLIGNELANFIFGNSGANFLDGGGGADIMTGFGGDDIYAIDNAGDLVDEGQNGGNDAIYTSFSYVLGLGASIEILAARDNSLTVAMNLFGNELNNIIFGNSGANFIDGGTGADIMTGFGGDDVYAIDNAGDVVDEGQNGGADTIYTNFSYVLGFGASVEILAARDNSATTAMNLFGNELDNFIFGNNGANFLDGQAGADTMTGFGGDDIYVVDNANDRVVEDPGGGSDSLYTNLSYVLAAGHSIETLAARDNSLTIALNLTGNNLANNVLGNNGANVLNGGGGADVLLGFGGADMFAFTTAAAAGNADFIADFLSGTDKLALDDAVFQGIGSPGSFTAANFVAGTAAVDANDRIIYNAANGQLLYDADGSGAGAAVLLATLQGNPFLAASDFAVI